MASVGESCVNCIKEKISITMHKYSVLKEKIKDDECGWSNRKQPKNLAPCIF
jgi:hypothetical protein